jgi:uncharacterized Zn-finger protein|tara:strand:+ start:527 stop:748 length:222 start_codon:yes stop_codon:yes gene_type:complete
MDGASAKKAQQAAPAQKEHKVFHVKPSALPLSCPTPDMTLWNAHPKVYIPVDATGEGVCPYCGNKFILDGASE